VHRSMLVYGGSVYVLCRAQDTFFCIYLTFYERESYVSALVQATSTNADFWAR
jgi:hypothetical protein